MIATTNACPLHTFALKTKVALFIGTEKEGLSLDVLNQADGLLQIPMAGFTEGQNDPVSEAIKLQKLTTELRLSETGWELTES